MIHTRTHNCEGFTLIEIIIAIAIVGFMMAAATLGLRTLQKMGQRRATETSLRATKTAIDTYKLTVGRYPQNLKDLREKPTDSKLATKWPGVLLEKDPVDSWGEPFHYQVNPGKQPPYELYSDGDPDSPAKIDAWEL